MSVSRWVHVLLLMELHRPEDYVVNLRTHEPLRIQPLRMMVFPSIQQ